MIFYKFNILENILPYFLNLIFLTHLIKKNILKIIPTVFLVISYIKKAILNIFILGVLGLYVAHWHAYSGFDPSQ